MTCVVECSEIFRGLESEVQNYENLKLEYKKLKEFLLKFKKQNIHMI